MKSASGFPLSRIVIAVALSLLVHSLLLWQLPEIELPTNAALLPQLQAKLEPLPRLKKKPVLRQPKAPPSTAPQAKPEPSASIPPSDVVSVPAAQVASSAPAAADSFATIEETVVPPHLPKHAQLHFTVQYGSGSFKVGEINHVLENIDGHYTLLAETQTTGLVSMFKSYYLRQRSSGIVTGQGLLPESYEEAKADASGKHISTANFDWTANAVHFSNGKVSALNGQTQDALSLPYQLSQLPMNVKDFPIALSTGKTISHYRIAIGEETIISTAMGELLTIPLQKVHGANEDGLIIWLALEYRLLPVKILYLNKSGEVTANMVITDIRVSDE